MATPTQWSDRIRAQILHGNVWVDRRHRSPLDGVIELFERSSHGRKMSIVVGIVPLLADRNLVARTGGVLLLERIGAALGARRLVRLIEANLDQLVGVPPADRYSRFAGADLAEPIQRLLATLDDPDAARLVTEIERLKGLP
jgi:hypothetical protein